MAAFGTPHLSCLDGSVLHWVTLGVGRPVLLLHGLGDSHQTWRRLAPKLAASGRRVLAPDLPGHGLSGRPDASYSVEWYAEVVGRWIDELELGEIDLVGHSLGGGVALALLATHGARVGRLGLIASGGLGREVSAAVKLLGVPGIERLLGAGLAAGTRVALRFAGGGHEPGARRWHAWANGAPGTARALTRTVKGVVGPGGQRASVFDQPARIRELPPTALFWGERDPVIPVRHGVAAVSRIPGATLRRFPDCGHFPHLEQPEAVAASLIAFLAPPEPTKAEAIAGEPGRWRRRLRWLWGKVVAALHPPPWLLAPRPGARRHKLREPTAPGSR